MASCTGKSQIGELLTNFGLHLCTRVDLDARQLYRLVGIGLSNFDVEGNVELEASLIAIPRSFVDE